MTQNVVVPWGVPSANVEGYSNPRHVIEYTSDGEVRQEFSTALTSRTVYGTPDPQRRVQQPFQPPNPS